MNVLKNEWRKKNTEVRSADRRLKETEPGTEERFKVEGIRRNIIKELNEIEDEIYGDMEPPSRKRHV